MIALGATASNDGIVNIPGANGTGAFAVATANVGTSASITASADTDAANLPVNITICQTNPASGQCLTEAGTQSQLTIGAGDTPTFSVFVQGSASIPFSPAVNRVFVRFKDSSGIVRGSTSVAVRTQ